MAARKTPQTFGGNNIQSSTYASTFLRDSGVGDVWESAQVTADVSRDFPQYVRGQPQGRVLTLLIKVQTRALADVNTLKQWFTARADERTLTATDEAGNTIRVRAKVLKLQPSSGIGGSSSSVLDWMYNATLWVSRPVWENNTPTDSTTSITSSGQTVSVTNNGSDNARPQIIISPTSYKAAANDNSYQRHVVIANRSTLPLQDAQGNGWPIELTGGGWNINAAVKAGTLHPQGYDVHVFANGVEVNRYLSNWGAGFGDSSAASTLLSSNYTYIAQKFQLPGCSDSETNTIGEVGFFLKINAGTPVGTLVCKIRTDNAGAPSTTVVTNGTTNTVNVNTLTGSYAYVAFTFAANPVLTAKTWYWLEISFASLSTNNGTNNVGVGDQLTTVPASGSPQFGVYSGMYENLVYGIGTSSNETTWATTSTALRTTSFRVFPTGNAKIWSPMYVPPGTQRTLAQGTSGGNLSPNLELLEEIGVSGMPVSGAVLVESECITYNGVNGTNQLIMNKRGARGTTTVTHNGGVAVYLVDVDVRIVYNYNAPGALSKTLFEPAEFAPVIDGVNSTNSQMRWIGPFLAPGNETRSGAWLPATDDTVALYTSVSLDGLAADDLANVTFKDAVPAGNYLLRNCILQQFPAPIATTANAVTLDEPSIPGQLSVQHLFTNSRGEESVFATHRSPDQGTGKTLTPTSDVYRYRMRVLNEAILGCETGDGISGGSGALASSGYYSVQEFVLDNPCAISAVALRGYWGGSLGSVPASQTADVVIMGLQPSTGSIPGAPDTTNIIGSVTGNSISTGYSWQTYRTVVYTFASPVTLPAGTYYVGYKYTSAGQPTATFSLSAGITSYARGKLWTGSANNNMSDTVGVTLNSCGWFRVYGTGIVQNDSPSGSGNTLTIDNFIFNLDTALNPTVLFESSDANVYMLDAILENTTYVIETGASLVGAITNAATTLYVSDPSKFFFYPYNQTIQIDSEQMTVTGMSAGASPASLTVIRGVNGTTAASHSDGVPVSYEPCVIVFKALLDTSTSLEFDTDRRVITSSDGSLSDPSAAAAIVSMYDLDPMVLAPGANTLKWTEQGVVATSLRTRFRDAYL